MNRFIPRLTYANVVSTLCLLLVVGGGSAFAATRLGRNTVGTDQLKQGAVTTAKIRNGAVTGAKIDTKNLDTVPSARHATEAGSASKAAHANVAAHAEHAASAGFASHAGTADTAMNANHATSADAATEAGHAKSADSATNAGTADHATTADSASTLGGLTPQAFVRGPGSVGAARVQLEEDETDFEALTVPGFGVLGAACQNGDPEFTYRSESNAGALTVYETKNAREFEIEPNRTYEFAPVEGNFIPVQMTVGGQTATVLVGRVANEGNRCTVTLQVTAATAG
jgi:hypothetical protein